MRRALAILKYVPAVLCGLLVVAWVVSLFVYVNVQWCQGSRGGVSLVLDYGSLNVCRNVGFTDSGLFLTRYSPSLLQGRRWPGMAYYWSYKMHTSRPMAKYINDFELSVPFSALLTISLPIAFGILGRFRFPLWSYFAWTALIAAELAYYLR